MKAKVDAIAAHGITCVVNRQLIYNYPESLLNERGIMSIEHADFDGVERIWHRIFYNELRFAPNKHPIFLTEAPLERTAKK
jgi:hypothetical protein